MVSERGQVAQDRLLPLRRLPQVSLLHEGVPHRAGHQEAAGRRLRARRPGEHDRLQAPFLTGLRSHTDDALPQILAVDVSAFPHASDAHAYLMGGGQVIFNGKEDIVAEIRKFL